MRSLQRAMSAVTVQLAQSLKSEGFTFIALHPGASLFRARVQAMMPLCEVRANEAWQMLARTELIMTGCLMMQVWSTLT